MRWLDGDIDSVDVNLSKPQGVVKSKEAWRAAGPGAAKSQRLATEQQQRWCSPQRAAPGRNNHSRV